MKKLLIGGVTGLLMLWNISSMAQGFIPDSSYEYHRIATCDYEVEIQDPISIVKSFSIFRNRESKVNGYIFYFGGQPELHVPQYYSASITGINAGARLIINSIFFSETLYLNVSGSNSLGMNCRELDF